MTFYDELGVPPDAPMDEVRRAYIRLSKRYHPDLQRDEESRHEAEWKMRRLNHIQEVLMDPDRRQAYDLAALEPVPAVVTGPAIPKAQAEPWTARLQMPVFAAVSAILIGASGLWMFWDDVQGWGPGSSGPRAAATASGGEPDEPDKKRQPSVPERKTRASEGRKSTEEPEPRFEMPTVPRPVAPPKKPEPDPSTSKPAVPSVTLPPTVQQDAPQSPPPPQAKPPDPPVQAETKPVAQPAAPEPRYEGIWLFAPSRRVTQEKLYAPKYIELKIDVEEGVIFGRYRGQYDVHDQPISPNVNFTFKGKPTGTATTLKWVGPGGAHGDVILKLVGPRSIQVDWKAEDTGPGLDLVAGTAVLVRRLD